MLTTLTTALLSLLTIDLDNSDLLLRHRRLRTRILGPPDTAIKLRLLNAAQKECRVATLKIPANGAADAVPSASHFVPVQQRSAPDDTSADAVAEATPTRLSAMAVGTATAT